MLRSARHAHSSARRIGSWCNRSRSFGSQTERARPKPDKIWRVRTGKDDKYIRVNGNTIRDGQQSLVGGQHRIEHLEEAAKLAGQIRSPDLEYPGVEEVGGGTTVDFPLRYKGENPFDNMVRITKHLNGTPAMALTRSDSICSYSVNPKDVVDSFVRLYYKAGIDVFRNFDAYNNPENHVNIAEAVNKHGGHYQGAITYTTHEDPTLYNVKWVAQMAKALRDLGAHSLAIKDMSGIASPVMMKAWVNEIKSAVPELPLVIHSHYTTGFAPITYLAAVEAGADAVDCAISSHSGRTGHPSMEVLANVFEDMGYDHGLSFPAMAKLADYYRSIQSHYQFAEPNMAGSCDYRVFQKGIPGGQISIFRNELEQNGLGHLFDAVMNSIQEVRNVVGGVALVTPTADNVARQTVINAMAEEKNEEPYGRFWMGFNEMLRGALGQPKEKMNEQLQFKALLANAEEVLEKQLVAEGVVSEETAEKIKKSGVLSHLQKRLWDLSVPIQHRLRMDELSSRIEQLNSLNADQKLGMDKKIAALNGAYHLGKDVADTVSKLQSELQSLKGTQEKSEVSEDEYVSILRKKASTSLLDSIWSSHAELKQVRADLSDDAVNRLTTAAAFVTVPPIEVLEPGMEQYKNEVEQLALEHGFDLPAEGSEEAEQWTVLYAMFKFNQDIALNFFTHSKSNPDFWPPVPGVEEEEATPTVIPKPQMFPFISKKNPFEEVQLNYVPSWPSSQVETVLKAELDALTDNHARKHAFTAALESSKSKVRKEIYRKDIERLQAEETKIVHDMKARFRQVNRNVPNLAVELDGDKALDSEVEQFFEIVRQRNAKNGVKN